MAICPECDAEVELDEYDVDKGDLVSCAECGSNLQVSSLSPLELDVASDADDDDEDEDEEVVKGEEQEELGVEEDEGAEKDEDWDE